MTEWTADRLTAQPEDTVIRLTFGGEPGRAARSDETDGTQWSLEAFGAMARYTSEELLAMADHGSVRVVSAPIDALLSEGTVIASTWFVRHPAARVLARSVLDAAVGYVTGDPD